MGLLAGGGGLPIHFSAMGITVLAGKDTRFPPLSVPLNFIPTTLNPQHLTSPAPAGLLQKSRRHLPPHLLQTPVGRGTRGQPCPKHPAAA